MEEDGVQLCCGHSPQPSRGVWGHAPPENISTLDLLRVILGRSDHDSYSNFYKDIALHCLRPHIIRPLEPRGLQSEFVF